MADKKNPLSKDQIIVQAKAGRAMPVFYRKAWVRVTESAPVSFQTAELAYESKIEIRAALADGDLLEVAPAPAPAAKSKKQAAVAAEES